eukprot:693220-Amphidinium_carterae.1
MRKASCQGYSPTCQIVELDRNSFCCFRIKRQEDVSCRQGSKHNTPTTAAWRSLRKPPQLGQTPKPPNFKNCGGFRKEKCWDMDERRSLLQCCNSAAYSTLSLSLVLAAPSSREVTGERNCKTG